MRNVIIRRKEMHRFIEEVQLRDRCEAQIVLIAYEAIKSIRAFSGHEKCFEKSLRTQNCKKYAMK
jgi:hypothetical protein